MKNTLFFARFELERLINGRIVPACMVAVLMIGLFAVGSRFPGVIAEEREQVIGTRRILVILEYPDPDNLARMVPDHSFLSMVGAPAIGKVPRQWRALTTVNSADAGVVAVAAPMASRDLLSVFYFFLPIVGIIIGGAVWPEAKLLMTLTSLPVPRWQLLLGKGVAIAALLALMFLVFYGLIVAMFAISPFGLQAEVAVRMAWFCFVSFQYTLIFSFIAILCSVLISRKTAAQAVSLLLFVILVVLIPVLIDVGTEHPNRFAEMARRRSGAEIPLSPLVELGRLTPGHAADFINHHTTSVLAGVMLRVYLGESVRNKNIPLHSYLGHLRREFASLAVWLFFIFGGAVIGFTYQREVCIVDD